MAPLLNMEAVVVGGFLWGPVCVLHLQTVEADLLVQRLKTARYRRAHALVNIAPSEECKKVQRTYYCLEDTHAQTKIPFMATQLQTHSS